MSSDLLNNRAADQLLLVAVCGVAQPVAKDIEKEHRTTVLQCRPTPMKLRHAGGRGPANRRPCGAISPPPGERRVQSPWMLSPALQGRADQSSSPSFMVTVLVPLAAT